MPSCCSLQLISAVCLHWRRHWLLVQQVQVILLAGFRDACQLSGGISECSPLYTLNTGVYICKHALAGTQLEHKVGPHAKLGAHWKGWNALVACVRRYADVIGLIEATLPKGQPCWLKPALTGCILRGSKQNCFETKQFFSLGWYKLFSVGGGTSKWPVAEQV